ncbi:MAG TPA: hypothetical protein VFX40_04820, partial [Gemmatimonadaceae bacterium]|nr:hypothetical protein [Gemmatimonadaceae bacterium]
ETVGGLPVPSAGIQTGKLGFTKFDRCLCAGETGYFILEAMHFFPNQAPGSLRLGMAGRFRIQSRQIHLIGDGGETRASPEGDNNIYLVRDQARSLDSGRIRIDVSRWITASSSWFLLSWMFREA